MNQISKYIYIYTDISLFSDGLNVFIVVYDMFNTYIHLYTIM